MWIWLHFKHIIKLHMCQWIIWLNDSIKVQCNSLPLSDFDVSSSSIYNTSNDTICSTGFFTHHQLSNCTHNYRFKDVLETKLITDVRLPLLLARWHGTHYLGTHYLRHVGETVQTTLIFGYHWRHFSLQSTGGCSAIDELDKQMFYLLTY